MNVSRVVSSVAVALAAVGLACSNGSAASPEKTAASAKAPAPANASVVAEGGGVSITSAELDAEIGAENLADLRQREYDLKKSALDSLLETRLLQKEAESRKMSVEQLKKLEVSDKTPAPDKAEVATLYQQNERRLGGMTREQGMAAVEQAVRSRGESARMAAYRRELMVKHGVKVSLAPPRYDVAVPADAPVLGPAKAPVTIVEFADYQCPFCHQAQGAVEEIIARYKGKVRLVHRDFPLDGIHPRATPASRASRCAGAQGKFWEYHRGLLAATGDLSDNDLKQRAQTLGLDKDKFASCLATENDAPVKASLEDGRKLGVSATPTFFVNGRRLVGARQVQDFVDVIEDELARGSS